MTNNQIFNPPKAPKSRRYKKYFNIMNYYD